MLAFVTSLRHPVNSRDYRRVERLLRDSIASWVRQTSPDFTVVVVGNRDPHLPAAMGAHVVEVDFDPPAPLPGSRPSIAALRRDKGTKLAVGVLKARALGATHVMTVDADDFVSRRIAAFVASDLAGRGWAVTDGWRINVERATVRRAQGTFNRQCGSSQIVNLKLLPEPALATTATQAQLHDGFGDVIERWLGSHMYMDEDLALPSLPFPGALYRVGTGESHSGNALGGIGRPISRALAEEFGVQATSRNPIAQLRAFLPSARAIRERMPQFGR